MDGVVTNDMEYATIIVNGADGRDARQCVSTDARPIDLKSINKL